MKPKTWYHTAFTYDGKKLTTYVNGQPDREGAISGKIEIAKENFTIGSYKGTAYFWKGLLDEIRLSQVARTQDEIKKSMNGLTLPVDPFGIEAVVWGNIKARY